MIGPADYTTQAVPSGYICSQCGATRCKLWRYSNTVSPDLFCADCAAGDQERDISEMDTFGRTPMEGHEEMPWRTNNIGWLLPAIPDTEGGAYWGYTSAPQEAWIWWERLANHEDKAYIALRWACNALDKDLRKGLEIMPEWRDWLEYQVRPLL